MNFRIRVKRLCAARRITQKELARRMGISDICLNRSLRIDYPHLQTLEKIAIALNVPMTAFFELDNPQSVDEVLTCPKCGQKFKLL